MKYYGLYKITNLTNGKMYIGQHTTDDLDDGYMGSGLIMKNALKKYGVENFRKEWIMFCEDADDLNYWESVFVDETWVMRSDTYNLKVGGCGGSAKGVHKGSIPWNKGRKNVYTESQLKKMSEAHSGRNNPMYGVDRTYHIRKLANLNRGRSLSDEHKKKIGHSNKGKKRTDTTREKLRTIQGGRHWYNNGVICVRARNCPNGFVPGRTISNEVM